MTSSSSHMVSSSHHIAHPHDHPSDTPAGRWEWQAHRRAECSLAPHALARLPRLKRTPSLTTPLPPVHHPHHRHIRPAHAAAPRCRADPSGVGCDQALYLLHLWLWSSGRSWTRLGYYLTTEAVALVLWRQLVDMARRGDNLAQPGLTAYDTRLVIARSLDRESNADAGW